MKIELSFSSSTDEKLIEGRITAKDENYYAHLDITLDFIKDYIPLDDEEEIIVEVSETCEEKAGKICQEQEECSGETVYAKDDICCLGTCSEQEQSSTGKIIGWAMVAVIFVFLVWFFKKKYRGAKKPINLLKIGRKK